LIRLMYRDGHHECFRALHSYRQHGLQGFCTVFGRIGFALTEVRSAIVVQCLLWRNAP
jgi:hypothetical protein